MKENTKKGVSRREFLGLSALGLASLTILPSWAMNGVRIAPSDRVVLGFIGLGQQALSDFKGFAACPGVQVAACCDVDTMKTERFRRRVAEWQASKGMNQRCDQYEFYEDLLERKDIDAIEVATPDHWHALATIHSCQSGKDVYCQKPLAYTISEGSVARQSRYTGYTVSPIRGSFSRFSCHGRASRQLFSCSKTACCSLMEKMAEEIAFIIAFPFVNFNFCMHYTIRFSICHSTCG